jgi:GH25 family lysozyme M1 (1,4-beta-N-acetylmuramidase)
MKRSEPHITRLMQHGLISQGFTLPKFGADGDWGDETQRAYDAYTARFEGPEVSNIISAVVDLSHHNRVEDFNTVKADGIVGVIHKATKGFRYTDPTAWSTWTMWQYTDGAIGPEPHVVDGIGHCDRDKFNGNFDALERLWIRSEW